MAGLFNPTLLAASSSECRFVLPIEVTEPYLNDHQPGGDPLFSTVMALEAAIGAARRVSPSADPALIENIRVLRPYIARGDGPHVLELRVTSSPLASGQSLDCTVLSKSADGAEMHHLHTRVNFAPPAAAASAPTVRSSIFSPRSARAPAAVYDLFFHGPAFQVVADAEFQIDRMLGRLRPRLPASHRNAVTESETAPRLIEFGLQSAGLLELAVSGRMMIPHSIAHIERLVPVDVDHPGEITSIARFGTPERIWIDIEILDEHGRLIMRIDRYRTEPLPFAVNQAAAARLRTELLRSDPTGPTHSELLI